MGAGRCQLRVVFLGEDVALQVGEVHHPGTVVGHPCGREYVVGDEGGPDGHPVAGSAGRRSVGMPGSLVPFERTGCHRGLESDDARVLFLEHPEAVLVMVVDDASARHKFPVMTVRADTDPANNSSSLRSWSSILCKGVFVSSDRKARKAQKNNTMTWSNH